MMTYPIPLKPMNRTFCLCKYVASWVFCLFAALLFATSFLPSVFGQNVFPPLTPVNVANFTIPFEFTTSTDTIREVELLVSKDRGRRWYSVAKQPVEAKKFNFQADTEGEYWFAFRTTMLTGNMSPLSNMPQLRVLVDTKNPMVVLPSQPSESGPLTPPKPERYREGKTIHSAQQARTVRSDSSSTSNLSSTKADKTSTNESATPLLGPRLPGFDPAAMSNTTENDLLDDLMSGMNPFLDIQPAAARGVPNHSIAADKSSTASAPPVNTSPGGISGIFLNNTATKPQIVVKWNIGSELLRGAQIDVLRSSTKEGQRSPIAINLPNSGEYWWFLTPEDLKPFYITVRIRSLQNGVREDVTQTAITVDPQLPLTSSNPNNRF